MKHQLITQAEYTSNLVVRRTFGCAVFVRVSRSPSGWCAIQCGFTPSTSGWPRRPSCWFCSSLMRQHHHIITRSGCLCGWCSYWLSARSCSGGSDQFHDDLLWDSRRRNLSCLFESCPLEVTLLCDDVSCSRRRSEAWVGNTGRTRAIIIFRLPAGSLFRLWCLSTCRQFGFHRSNCCSPSCVFLLLLCCHYSVLFQLITPKQLYFGGRPPAAG